MSIATKILKTMTYRAILVDDEIDNLDLLDLYIKKYCPQLKVCAKLTNVSDTISAYYEHNPHIMFLDIQLGDEDSFTILDSITDLESEIIFVSSYDEYAIKAISYDTCGYVLKPIDPKSITTNVSRAIKSIEEKKHERLKSTCCVE